MINKIPIPTPSLSASTPVLIVVTETPSIFKSPVPENNYAEIASTSGWQSTGVNINSGNILSIVVIGGSWTSQRSITPYSSGDGNAAYICGNIIASSECVEPMPDFPAGGLIGQIGDQKFWVGNKTTITIQQSGILQLRINDGDDGLNDNDGTLQVKITVK